MPVRWYHAVDGYASAKTVSEGHARVPASGYFLALARIYIHNAALRLEFMALRRAAYHGSWALRWSTA